MDSANNRIEDERRRQQDIRKNIALLQLQLSERPEIPLNTVVYHSPKKNKREGSLLVPPTPSPKKKRKLDHDLQQKPPGRPGLRATAKTASSSRLLALPITAESQYPKPATSNILSKLAALDACGTQVAAKDPANRSTSFADCPELLSMSDISKPLQKRDERLALIDEINPGPYGHVPPTDDPNFYSLEPHSGIRLLSRKLPYDDFQEHMSGRFYISPSRLYSSIRLLPDKQGYDVPVAGDWITIAVVAERGPIKYSRAPINVEYDDREKAEAAGGKWAKKKTQAISSKSSGKKYVNFKLIDFGARSGSSATGGKSVIRGDAFLSLLLFESDSFELVEQEGTRPRKLYKGGSKGAFEAMSKLMEGDVIALLNPRVLKPFQRSNDSPHPVTNILALSPDSAESIAIIGRSRDLGLCPVSKRDGKPCGNWFDKRLSDVCEFHIQAAVQRQRSGRPEFAIGTSGMSSSSLRKKKVEYDPARQWGLKPEDTSTSSATYVIGGHVVSGSAADPRSMYLSETIGREGQAKAKRKIEKHDADSALSALLSRDKEGMKAVIRAREVGYEKAQETKEKRDGSDRKSKRVNGPATKSAKSKRKEDLSQQNINISQHSGKSAYSAEVIKQLGFDPIAKAGQRKVDDLSIQKKLESLQAVCTNRNHVALGPRSRPKIRSVVTDPTQTKTRSVMMMQESVEGFLENFVSATGPKEALVDLDDL